MKNGKDKYKDIVNIAFILFPFFYGMFYEFCGSIASVLLSVLLFVILVHRKSLSIYWTWGMGLALLFLAACAASIPFAVDSGMAALGIFKYLWIFLYLLAVQQMQEDAQKKLLRWIPYIGVWMCGLGMAAYSVPALYDNLYANHRLGGAFQYPNTFALFLLCGLIMICSDKDAKKRGFLYAVVLVWGIAVSGSRTVFVLMVISLLYIMIRNGRWNLLIGMLIGGAAFAIYFVATGNTEHIGRITTISLQDSTFVGRLLYMRDALPLLLKYPLGMGHMGYYYVQNMIQTGVYAVKYVHNDWLQIGLDMGLVPMLVYLLVVIKALKSKEVSKTNKLMLLVIFLHGLLDFDLAYGAIYGIVLLILNEIPMAGREKKSVSVSWKAAVPFFVLITVLGSYMTVPLVYYYNEDMEETIKWYPWHTEAKIMILSKTTSLTKAEKLADEILKQNDTCALAYYAKAVLAYNNGDFVGMIQNQREVIKRNYMDYDAYLEFAYMLYGGMEYCESENEQMYEMCRQELLAIPDMLEAAKGKVSSLGAVIDDKPRLEVDSQLKLLLDSIDKT